MKHLSNNNFNNNQLDNVPLPVDPDDAVNKAYADTKIQGVNTHKITSGSTEPNDPQEGDLWLDDSGTDYPLDTYLAKSANLSDLSNIPAARTSLGLENVTNTSDTTKNSATATLTNKTISGNNNTITNIGPDARVGGFKMGIIPGSTFASTGNKTISGVGFKPKLVRLEALPTNSTTAVTYGSGAMTEDAQYWKATLVLTAGGGGRMSGTDGAIAYQTGASVIGMKAGFVSMNADGFTINVATPNSAFDVVYIAEG